MNSIFFIHSFHHKMRPLIWIQIMLIVSQASGANGNAWKANYPKMITAYKGDDVIIPCNVTHPMGSKKSVEAYWKKNGPIKLNTTDVDNNEFIYHPINSNVMKRFQERTSLIGDMTTGNCSLKIKNINDQDTGPFYLRISNGTQNYSFFLAEVRFNITEHTGTDLPLTRGNVTNQPISTESIIYVVSIVPAVAVLLVSVFGSIYFFYYRKRCKSVIRQESQFYANSTPTTPTPKTEKINTTKTIDALHVPPGEVMDDPIYLNYQEPNDDIESTDEVNLGFENVREVAQEKRD
ncbi:hypothetical protein DPEC_G00145220 [Dallia pectoralis]|uniref:Uncharacterized protein n=1 Tax=Dallia pectoralis TaxID=75939 RepID=A0ACC2GP27_DALPE|nr:hypothetical protein DPEC_G00145220 [Dallia pectoralis]